MRGDVDQVAKMAKETDVKLETIIEAKLVESVSELKKSQEHVTAQTSGLKREDVQEEIEKEKRKLNLVVMGLKEEMDDKGAVENVLTALNVTTGARAIKSIERIGKAVTGKVRPVRIVMLNNDSRVEILKACPNLRKNAEYKGVFVVPDLTRKQQEADKILRDKYKELKNAGETDIRLNKGKIVKKLAGSGDEVILFPTQS
jgi:hypothetical protein